MGTKFPKINPNLHSRKGAFLFTGTETQNLALSQNRIVLNLTLIYTAEKGAFLFTSTETQNLALSQTRIVLNLTLIYTAEKGAFHWHWTQNLTQNENKIATINPSLSIKLRTQLFKITLIYTAEKRRDSSTLHLLFV